MFPLSFPLILVSLTTASASCDRYGKPHVTARRISIFINYVSINDANTSSVVPNFDSQTGGTLYGNCEKTRPVLTNDIRIFVLTSICINVPDNSSVLISLPFINIKTSPEDDSYSLTLLHFSVADSKGRRWSVSQSTRPTPELFHTSDVTFEFHCPETSNGRFFRLRFSYHKDPLLPQRLSDGFWNCSVPYWPDFKRHLDCNLNRECSAGEDEAGCDYESPDCGPGLISTAGGCYRYLKAQSPVSWYQADEACKKNGAYLASFNTPTEWVAIGAAIRRLQENAVFVGLRLRNPFLPQMYQKMRIWADGIVAYYGYIHMEKLGVCSVLDLSALYDDSKFRIKPLKCTLPQKTNILCEMKHKNISQEALKIAVSWSNVTSVVSPLTTVIKCPKGHVTHSDFACDVRSLCWGRGFGSAYTCDAPMTPLPPSFTCGPESVPYALVCDFRQDCADGSDEEFCVFPSCASNEFRCGVQCVAHLGICDGVKDCSNGVDENWCNSMKVYKTQDLPAMIEQDKSGYVTVIPLKSFECTATTFACTTAHLCLSLELRCNSVKDCPGSEDEADCETCSGLYRCRDSRICLHPDSLCDGMFQCPQGDDESLCRLPCPQNCTCYGLSVYCRHVVSHQDLPDLRFLEARGSRMNMAHVVNKTMLVYLGLDDCGLRHLDDVHLPNLYYLHVRDNLLTELTSKIALQFPHLQELLLDGNPIVLQMTKTGNSLATFPSVTYLGLSRILIPELDFDILAIFPKLRNLNLSGCGIEVISQHGSNDLTELATLDVRECPLTSVPTDLLRYRNNLETVFADSYKLCCPAMLPEDFNLVHCHAPGDEISSCDALLRSDTYRVLLSVFAVMAIVGNLGSFTYRVINRSSNNLGFAVFVTHLSVADLLMGVYLSIIGVADRIYLGNYLWGDNTWKHSSACSLAGILSLLSSEVSAFVICLITLDRFLVLKFPFGQLRFRQRSAHIACGFAWTIGIVLAIVPRSPMMSHWEFYSQNGICLPLPITQKPFAGHLYSFSVMIVLNFVLFILIAAGQLSIYYTVRINSISTETNTTSVSKDMVIARRLITIAMSDFLCWFPIGLLGLLASSGTPIPGELNVAIAILALPLNSALNPFLYTLNMILERRRRLKEKRLQKFIMAAQQGKSTTVPSGFSS